MDWTPDRSKKVPIYKQIAEYIESGILDGTFPPESVLPSERVLAKDLQVNRSTVVAAYDELQANGLIERKKGSGTIVNRGIWGFSKKRIPSWNRYIEAGSFLPNLPMVQQIRMETEVHNPINLASGELSDDLIPYDFFRKVLVEKTFAGRLGYDHPQGNIALRETISEHVREFRNIETRPSSILITSGAQQALHLIIQCLLTPGDAVAIEDPSYSYSLPVFRSAGLKTFLLPVDQYGINPDDLISLNKKHRIRMIFVNPFFQNPTGAMLSSERRKKILEISEEYGIPVIEDDPYSLTSFSGEKIATLKSSNYNNVLYVSSLSKIVASGLRIGWIIGPTPVIERLADAKQQVDFGHSTFTQWMANEFLQTGFFSSHINFLRDRLKQRRDQITSSLDQFLHEQVEFSPPNGGIHLWCKLKTDIDETSLLQESIKYGVVFVPGTVLGSQKGFIRFTFSREKAEFIHEGIGRFAQAIERLESSKKNFFISDF
ncbi:MocR-like pyridoxine biosynthesis transcription factor PdxR [Neobacillus ginsengisoli]|uniref:DNA-binding transcriptional MocR family regulator n=1 Tax=Neobacillus ginsengisoli TaxID=904295 RepID=A0ABT9XSY4_9BACI|nr:PLP-dependent aminotransferase family protein [Neobacillus ginsengisoli]MDQ0198666.1 DNA-binding transcriptional MocR family regulator [Neobacillus ginsengisoli]